MDLSDLTKEQLIEEVTALRREVIKLTHNSLAFNVQNELLKTLATISRTASGNLALKALLQKALSLATTLTKAEESSFFLLNEQGVILEAILARGATVREERQSLIGKVLESGLAGWVGRNRQVGLVTDTIKDERWIALPNEPYSVRSALCVPLFRGKSLLGILTLMHSQPGHFNAQSAQLMQTMANPMALTFENAIFCLDSHREEFAALPVEESSVRMDLKDKATVQLDTLGIYMIVQDGKFLYANSQLADIFGYSFSELIALESLCELASQNQREEVSEQIHQCLQGKTTYFKSQFLGKGNSDRLIPVETYGSRTKLYGKTVIIGVLNAKTES